MINLHEVTLKRGAKTLFNNVNLALYDGHKIGIVGKNGCGKTSLFAFLLGKLESAGGSVHISDKLDIATVQQESPDSEKSIVEYVIDADQKLRQYQNDLAKAEEENNTDAMADLYDAIINIDGFSAESRAAVILIGLGFSDEELQMPVNSMSGGWKMRINIARALFVHSDILLLDEPTNHLDLDAVIWLEKWLQKYSGLLLVISHDKEFLDKICSHIIHIEHKAMKLYTGNYSSFEKIRAEQLALQQKQYEKQQKQVAHLEKFINRFKAKASKAKQAQSRVKTLEKMQLIMPAYADSPFNFEFKEPDNIPNPLVTLDKVSVGYEEKIILENIDFQLRDDDRIGLLGKNGAGKSTFIKLLAGGLSPKSGELTKNGKLNIGYFSQHTGDSLDLDKTPLDIFKEVSREMGKEESELNIRKYLGGFNFSGDMSVSQIRKFSGGEKSRLALSVIVYKKPNVLLLDEPTNHLDIEMRQALIMALQGFAGAVVTISHDRYWLRQVIDNYYLVNDQSISKFTDELDDYYEWLLKKESRKNSSKNKSVVSNNKDISDKKQELKSLEKKLATLQQDIKNIDEELVVLSQDAVKNNDKIVEIQKIRDNLEEQYSVDEKLWVEVSEFLDGV